MRQALVLGMLLAVGTATSPAWARYTLTQPSPCDHVIPTGLPLPRQSIADGTVNGALMQASPNPTWRDRPIGIIGRDEPVTVLQECGMRLRVRNVRGLEGWVATVMMQSERKAYDAARNRPPQTPSDCEFLYLDAAVIDRCKAKLQAQEARRIEVTTTPYMTGDELRRFLVGRTMTMVERHPDWGLKDPPIYSFAAPDGEYFMMRGHSNDLRHRGRYEVRGDAVCFPREGTFCGRLRKVGAELVWTAAGGTEFLVTGSDGDGFGVVEAVSRSRPDPVPPLIPPGAGEIAGPKL